MCGESRLHGVEWGKTRRLFQRVTYHYKIVRFLLHMLQSTSQITKKRAKYLRNMDKKILIVTGWNIEIFHCLKLKLRGEDFFDNGIFDIDSIVYGLQT